MPLPELTLPILLQAASQFAKAESSHQEPRLYGVTDGKAVGTYVEHKFRVHLEKQFSFSPGNSALGIDFPALAVDMKVTSVRQPQSSCPFKSAREKVYGLAYSLLVFVYDKSDNAALRTATLSIEHCVYVESARTADFQTTKGIAEILDRNGNQDDVVAFLTERNLPLDEIGAQQLAEEILTKRPEIGYLTVSNALQWRLQYKRVIELAGTVNGIHRL